MKKILFVIISALIIVLAGCGNSTLEKDARKTEQGESGSSFESIAEEQTAKAADYSTVIPFGNNVDRISSSPSASSERDGKVCIIIDSKSAAHMTYDDNSVIGICKLLGFNIFIYTDYTVIAVEDLSVDACDAIIKEFSRQDVRAFIFDLGDPEGFRETRNELALRHPDLTILPIILSEEEHKERELEEARSSIQGTWSHIAAGGSINIGASTITFTTFSTGPNARVISESVCEYVFEKNTEDSGTSFVLRVINGEPYNNISELIYYPSDPNHLYTGTPMFGNDWLYYR